MLGTKALNQFTMFVHLRMMAMKLEVIIARAVQFNKFYKGE